jgi:Trypsin-like serine proteases, typically periplasmic, contain C-terminal PDZ domain
VSGASSLTVKLWNGKTFSAQVVGTDASTDLAVLKISAPASELFPLTLGDSGRLVVGDNVVAIGAHSVWRKRSRPESSAPSTAR